jgi:hypothetical protein
MRFDRDSVTREPISDQPVSNRSADVVVSDVVADQVAGFQQMLSATGGDVRRLRRALLEVVRRLDDEDDV